MDRHPDSETLLAFREHRLSGAVVAEVAFHIRQCAQCAVVEPSAARALLEALAAPAAENVRDFGAARPPQRWLMAAAVAFTVVALAVIAFLARRDTTPVIVSKEVPRVLGPSGAQGPLPTEDPRTREPEAPVVASLADGTGRIELREDGTLAGVQPRTPRDAEDTRTVLSGHALAIPTFIAAMPGAVRGGDTGAHPLRAVEPFRSAVLESRPRFSWTPVRDARNYRVAVFDADYEEIAHSESVSGTSWTPSKPLPAGVDLSWHVVAETDAGELSSAGSNRAEAVFRVLTQKETADIDAGKTHYRDSHLLRGLLYSRYGLLHDAEREFRALAKQNPGSPIARELIDSVSR